MSLDEKHKEMRGAANGRVKDKRAIVTGGGSGIGAACCVKLAEHGAKVAVTDIDIKAAESVAAEIRSAGGVALSIKLDVTSEDAWIAAIEKIVGEWGGLEILVNNAGFGAPELLEKTELAQWRRIQELNLDGAFLGHKHAIPAMKASGSGSIINISSVGAMRGTPMNSPYCASKAGLRLLSKSAASECAMLGYPIRVNSVHPGFINTESARDIASRTLGKDHEKVLMQMIPLGHGGDPSDIAWGVLYLASDESRYVTGTELIIDGGMQA